MSRPGEPGACQNCFELVGSAVRTDETDRRSAKRNRQRGTESRISKVPLPVYDGRFLLVPILIRLGP